MVLPAPNLDDRHFQQLVDDAKRFVQERCPSWTDHNVSDPGITVIEAAASMVDQLLYRLNRVPELNYLKFLDLVGVELLPPAAARGQATFWLSAPQPQSVHVRAETEVATPRTDVETPIVFTTTEDLEIVACSRAHVATERVGKPMTDVTVNVDRRQGFDAFAATPAPGDAMLVGLSAAVPSCVVRLDITCEVRGIGIVPGDAPLVWEAWDGHAWTPCEVEVDETGGLNRTGPVVVHVPEGHQAAVMNELRAGWLRCRVIEPRPDQETYTRSPRVIDLQAATVGGTVGVIHAEVVRDEIIGVSDGTAAQSFPLQRTPVVPWDEPSTLLSGPLETAEEWTQVESFAASGPDDRHFHLDPVGGTVTFGPSVRDETGVQRSYGMAPPKGDALRLVAYRTGGGQRGNIIRGQIRVLKTSVPYVSTVSNRTPAVGGSDGETVADAKVRAPLVLRSRGRAVTMEDFELLAKEAAPDVARVRCVPAIQPNEAGGIRLLVIPHAGRDETGRTQLPDLTPPDAVLARITTYLNERRMVGTRLLVTVPEYVPFTAVVTVAATEGYVPAEVRTEVLRELYRFFDPIVGGPDGKGWPFGRPVQEHDLIPVLQRACLDTTVRPRVHLFAADPETWDRTETERVDVPPHGLLFSYDHQVLVVSP